MRPKPKIILLIIAITVSITVYFIIQNQYNKEKDPIKIGLFVTLTGVYPDLGRQIRDGALHAIDEINSMGGINGRQVRLIIRDNGYNYRRAIENMEALVQEGVVALIGPATSSQAMNLLPIVNEQRIVTISPTASSSLLIGKDDNLIRIRQSNKDDARLLGEYAKRLGVKKIIVVYDNSNLIYANDFINNFKETFSVSSNLYYIPFDPPVARFTKMARDVFSFKSDAVLIIAETYTTALLIQKIRSLNKDIIIFTSPWAKSQKLIEHAGQHSLGLITVDSVDDLFKGESYQRYRRSFFDRFGYYPGFGADTGYETIFVIKKAIESNPNPQKLKDTIIKIGEFEGLQGRFKIDKYGDAIRQPFILKVKNNSFHRVDNH
ncbi:MAG: ABC transporter substrate-binding protein [Thermodesulfovibrionales bacterium]